MTDQNIQEQEPPPSEPEVKETETQEEKPTVSNPKIRLTGDKDNCGFCKEGDTFFTERAKEAGATYEYHHIDSDRGKDIADNIGTDSKGNIPMPIIEYCKDIKEPGDKKSEEICDYVKGFNKSDWDPASLNYKKRNDVDSEIEDLFGDY